jgi:hypothetical protein
MEVVTMGEPEGEKGMEAGIRSRTRREIEGFIL